jgi:hypothetical protein
MVARLSETAKIKRYNCVLPLADLSGIQDYLFDVRETGGRQARSLRFRSLYIQLVAEAVGVRLLRAARLGKDRLIFCAGGKLAIYGAEFSDAGTAPTIEKYRIATSLRELGTKTTIYGWQSGSR